MIRLPRWALLALLLAAACRTGAGPGVEDRAAGADFALPIPPAAARPALVALVSIAGLTPDLYRGPAPLMPTLAELARAGVSAAHVEPVAPASTTPAHATLVTGRRPAEHGVVAERLLGDRGVRAVGFMHASRLRGASLWSAAGQAQRPVAAVGWPTTIGAAIAFLLPDVGMAPAGQSWLAALADKTTPWLLERARANGGEAAENDIPGAARDATLVGVACDVVMSPTPPALLLLHLDQPRFPVVRFGPAAEDARAAFAAADAQLARLLDCLAEAGRLAGAAVLVAGDNGMLPVHTALAPNTILEREGLLAREERGTALRGWRAVARTNGGSAFVYARTADDAVRARRVLSAEAEAGGRFRVASAEELLEVGADPEAWFGLEARPGFVFDDVAGAAPESASTLRGSGGYLPSRTEMAPGFVAWGWGVGTAVEIPWMRQTDVAPGAAALLGVSLEGREGRPLPGMLSLPGVAAPPAVIQRRRSRGN